MNPRTTERNVPVEARPTHVAVESGAIRKFTVRVIPLLFLAAVLSYIDRTNIGVAKLMMQDDLYLSETAFGLGAGIFFVAYVLFEVPSNIVLHRIGARIWITRIMVTWGLITALTAFVSNIWMFYAMRFLLGAAEAGLLPGVVLLLTRWVPSANRARLLGLFFLAIPVASALGAPITGMLMSFAPWGLAGWQFMFIVEGLPCLLLAVAIFTMLPDEPGDAPWLSTAEKLWITTTIAAEHHQSTGAEDKSARWTSGLRNPRVLALSLVYFSMVVPIYLVGFFLPSIVREMTNGSTSTTSIGFLVAIPYVLTGFAMVFIARSSDRRQERMWHFVVPTLVGASGFLLAAVTISSAPLIAACGISLGTVGAMATIPTFWTVAPRFVYGAAAAAGIALISSIGNIGGFVSPYMFGVIRQSLPGESGNSISFTVGAMSLLVGAVAMIMVHRGISNPDHDTTPEISGAKEKASE